MTTTALDVIQQDKIALTDEHKRLARSTIAKDLSEPEFQLYLYECNRQGIHPLDRLLIPIKRNDSEAGEKRMTFVTTVDLLRARAADTGDYCGNEDATFEYLEGAVNPQSATVIVWKMVQGQRCPFTATARWKEYYPGDGKPGFMWRAKPHVMLGKCAEALALRKAFPKQLAGLYAQEELERPDDMEPEREPIQPTTRKKAEAQPKQEVLPPKEEPQGVPVSFDDVKYITQKQLNRLLAIQGASGMKEETLKEWLGKRGVRSRKLIPTILYDATIDFIDPKFEHHEAPQVEEEPF